MHINKKSDDDDDDDDDDVQMYRKSYCTTPGVGGGRVGLAWTKC